MGLFHDDKEGARRALTRATASEVSKQTNKYTQAAAAALSVGPVESLVGAFKHGVRRKNAVAEIEAGVRISAGVLAIQDNVMHMQTAFARSVNDVKRLQNETARLDLEYLQIEREAEQMLRQNEADAATAPTLMKASHLQAEVKRLETLALAIQHATRVGIDPSYLYDDNFGIDMAKAIPVLKVEREQAERVFDKERVVAKIADLKVTSELDLTRKKKEIFVERTTPAGASDDELAERALRIVEEATGGIVEPNDPDRYLNAHAGTVYYQQLIEGASFTTAKKRVFDAVLLALKQDVRGQRKATRELALADLQSYRAKKAEYEQLSQAAGIGDLIEQVSGGRGGGDPFN